MYAKTGYVLSVVYVPGVGTVIAMGIELTCEIKLAGILRLPAQIFGVLFYLLFGTCIFIGDLPVFVKGRKKPKRPEMYVTYVDE
jgi:hypothetical protein